MVGKLNRGDLYRHIGVIILLLLGANFSFAQSFQEIKACHQCSFTISETVFFTDDGGSEKNIQSSNIVSELRAEKGKYLIFSFIEIDISENAYIKLVYTPFGDSVETFLVFRKMMKVAPIVASSLHFEYSSENIPLMKKGWKSSIRIKDPKDDWVQSSSLPESDCPNAIPLCANNTVVALAGQYTNLGDISDDGGSCYSGTGAGGSVWYSFTPVSNGPLDFRISPDGSTDYDFVLWDITDGCESNKRDEISCNYSAETGITGLSSTRCNENYGTCTGNDCSNQSKPADCNRFNNRVNVNTSRKYAICINFYSGSVDGFTLNFQNEATSVGITDNIVPSIISVFTPNCNNANTFNLKFSEWIDCSTLQSSDFTIPGYTVNLSVTNCNYNRTNGVTIAVSPSLPPGTYTLNATNILDLCGNPMNSNYQIVIGQQPNPSITPPVPVCKNPTPNGGTSNSPNNQVITASGGSRYVWSTGETTASITVNQAGTKTYTVTAYNGACFASASTTVIVRQANPVSLGPDKFYCGTPVVLTATPSVSGYNYQFFRAPSLGPLVFNNGTSVQNGTSPVLTVTPANNTTYRVIVTDNNGCKAQDDIVVKVTSSTGAAVITVPGISFCETGNPVKLTASPDGGTFSGPGMSGDIFYPNVAGKGLHTITYTTTNSCGTFTGTKNIRVIGGTSPVIGLAPTYCITDADVSFTPNPKCGTLFGTGIINPGTCNTANTNYNVLPVFSPSAAGIGLHTITYSDLPAGYCGNSVDVRVLDNSALPTISGLNLTYCLTEPAVNISATPTGGVFSGPGISGSVFTPSVAGVGNHPIKYKVQSCSGYDSIIVLVQVINASGTASISYSGPYCQTISSPQPVVISGSGGGTFSSSSGLAINPLNGAVTPSASQSGIYTVTYTVPSSGACTGTTASTTVEIISSTIPNFNPVQDICNGATVPALPSISINGISGSWSPSVISNTNGGTYVFTPNIGQCANVFNLNVNVLPSVVPVFSPVPPFCKGSIPPALPAISDNSITGIWNPLVIDNQNSAAYTFLPNVGQCAQQYTMNVTVNALPAVDIQNAGPLCLSESAILNASGANSYVWSPPDGLSSTTGSSVTATPIITTTYSVVGTDTNGCSNSDSTILVVHPSPNMSVIFKD